MEYKIIGFENYWVNENNQVIKRAQTVRGETVKVIPAVRTKDCEFSYIRITRRENGIGKRYTFPIDEIVAAAKLGIPLGTPESKKALKNYRHENGLMGRVSNAVGSKVREQEVVNLIHADIIRQMNGVGIHVDVDYLPVFVLSQQLFQYFLLCDKCSGQEQMLKVQTKNGESYQKNPLFVMQREMFKDLMDGFTKVGIALDKVMKELPPTIYTNVSTDMFEEQEKDDKRQKMGITWVN